MRTRALLILLAGVAGIAWAAETSRVPRPQFTIEKSGQCVAPTEVMRREHMDMLKHDRDLTMHLGVRKVQASLQGCVDCHAGSRTGTAAGNPGDFCQSCHEYAGVSLDCFQCHAVKPKSPRAEAKP